jgi:hypothetical protein
MVIRVMSLVAHGAIIFISKSLILRLLKHLHMKSGGQIDGHMSSQAPVVWWCRQVNCEVVGMCVDNNIDMTHKTLPPLKKSNLHFNWI